MRRSGSASRNYVGVHGFSSWYDDMEGVKKMRKVTETLGSIPQAGLSLRSSMRG
ncbi:MAG: hypothetical protein SVY10_21690 [Thermodesulfobacteriota bacterium]|nr:hypothetical protein [Thermodesulfobacteriota bacterium]